MYTYVYIKKNYFKKILILVLSNNIVCILRELKSYNIILIYFSFDKKNDPEKILFNLPASPVFLIMWITDNLYCLLMDSPYV